MRSTLLVLFCFGLCLRVSAQYFQFTQYNFTPQRINPASVANSNYALASFDYRSQSTGSGIRLNSNIVNASYPLLSRDGERWGGIGISLLDDRTGSSSIFTTQEFGLSYAMNIPLTKFQNIALGIKALHLNSKINYDGLVTGSQYIPDRGFDESMSNGEDVGTIRNNYNTFSAGLSWQQTDKKGNILAYSGLSFFDFNKPQNSFLGLSNTLHSTLVVNAGVQVYKKDKLNLIPEILYTRNASQNVLNAGLITRYELNSFSKKPSEYVDIITKYRIGRSGILGLQLHREKFSIGVSYDFPVIKRNVGNTGAFEIGLSVKQLVKRKQRSKSKRSSSSGLTAKKATKPTRAIKPKVVSSNSDSLKMKTPIIIKKENLSNRLKHKQDSLITSAQVGNIRHEPYVLEKATLHFSFQFNSTDLNEEATRYLDDLSEALLDNPELKIQLVGHTDNVGSDKFNLKLSIYRAESIKDYLIYRGVNEQRIITEGKGPHEPLQDNKTESGRAGNRRVEMTILY